MQQDASSIARFISALQQSGVKLDLNGIKFDLNAEEITNLLWLVLEINKNSAPVTSEGSAQQTQSTIANSPEISPIVETPVDKRPLPPVPQVPLVAERPQSDSKSTPALPISVPDAPALPRSLELSRSLRPLMRKAKSHYAQILDEAATVRQIADEKIWSPVMQPAPERWLELAIVVEETNLLEIWQKTIVEFQALMERHGAFRDVRTWQLVTATDGKTQLFRRKAAVVDRAQPRHPKELLDPTGRRLILFVSDCTSIGWQLGRVGALLQEWMGQNPVTVLQLLPERFWERTALGLGEFVWLGAESPGGRNEQFTIEGFPKLPTHSILLPIVTLDPKALLQWAKVIAGRGGFFTAGVLLNAAQLADDSQIEAEFVIDSSEPALLVQRFRETASPIARRLAEMMAAVPVSPSIIRLIQRNLLPQAGTVHLAEVFLSGLLQRVAPVEDEPQGLPHRYEFFDGVRQQLLRVVLIPDTEQVMDRVADDVLKRLPSEVRQQLSEDIERRLGRSMRSFEAFLLPELLEDLAIDEKAKAEVLPFAAVTREVLQGLGGEYAKLAERIQQVPQEVPSLVSPRSEDEPFPSLLEFEFETGVIDETLQPFEFTVATIELQARRRGKPKLVIHREQKQAWQFVETLGEVGLEMVSIPGGSFLMGSPENEPERYDNESPQHSVSVSSFFMGKYPITQAQWRIVAEFEQVNRSLNPDPSRFKGDDRPVENVSWLEAVEFCERLNRFVEVRLSRFTGKEYRLPTEAEWEYACRAGTQTPFHFGETITTDLANYDGNYAYGEGVKGQYREKTTPVGSFKVANSFGLYDMHGNVWEWCQDHWHKSYAGAPIDGSAWIDPDRDEEASRVLRGGSWINDPGGCRSATRVCAGVCQ